MLNHRANFISTYILIYIIYVIDVIRRGNKIDTIFYNICKVLLSNLDQYLHPYMFGRHSFSTLIGGFFPNCLNPLSLTIVSALKCWNFAAFAPALAHNVISF